jgi:excisionase family DNA binding protein
MNSEEKLVQGLKLVVEAFAEMVANNKTSIEATAKNVEVKEPAPNHMMQVTEARKYANLSDYMIRMLLKQGKIEHVRLGNRKIMISKAAIDKYFKKAENESVKKESENNFGLRKL